MSNKIKADEIHLALAQCTGSEILHRHALMRVCRYTQGVRLFAQMAEAYWFVDILATVVIKRHEEHEFIRVLLDVADGKAVIIAGDGDDNVIWRREIDHTDCPPGKWRFFMARGDIFLPSEW